MALKAGSVPVMPDLAVLGLVKSVGEAYLSQKEVYTVLPIELKGLHGGRGGVFFFLFQPSWFAKDFDPAFLLEADPILYSNYRRNVADEKRPSVLQVLVGDKFDEFAEKFDAFDIDPEPKEIADLIREYILGNETGYIMEQRTDKNEDGTIELSEQYNIRRFFSGTEDEAKKLRVDVARRVKNGKKPLVITWEEE